MARARGMAARRPTVETPVRGLYLAGDWVKLPHPAMLKGLISVPRPVPRAQPTLHWARLRAIPAARIRSCNAAPIRSAGNFVLYWMISSRRTRHSFALQHAAAWAAELQRPLVVLEALRVGYPWASERIHRFVIDGMADNERRLAATPVLYYPYVEQAPGAGKGLIEVLGSRAALVVTDDFPAFFLPRAVEAAAARCPVRLEAVDGNGLLPMRATERVFTTAASFRLYVQKSLRDHLRDRPLADPLEGADLRPLRALPAVVADRWPRARPSASRRAGTGARTEPPAPAPAAPGARSTR